MSALVEARHLSYAFPARGGFLWKKGGVKAVRDVNLTVSRGEVLGVVGESGCGKSTLGRLLLGLLHPSGGEILHEGRDMAGLSAAELQRRRSQMQIVFQDPFGSLDPRRKVGAQIADGIRLHRTVPRDQVFARVVELLEKVGLGRQHYDRLPHQFSGGQLQRLAIARALATDPSFIVADEPVSALDVSVQAQILNLIIELQRDLGLSIVFISHDLHVVRYICRRIVIMYLGNIVEEGDVEQIFENAAHPYTRMLLASAPSIKRVGVKLTAVASGDIPSPGTVAAGCPFRTRCGRRIDRCATDAPPLTAAVGNHSYACWNPELRAVGDAP